MRTACVMRPSDVMCAFARELEHITSLRAKRATSLCEAQHHGGEAAASLYKVPLSLVSPFFLNVSFVFGRGHPHDILKHSVKIRDTAKVQKLGNIGGVKVAVGQQLTGLLNL